MDLMKQLAVPTILGKIQDGDWDVVELVEETGQMTMIIKADGATKAETINEVEGEEVPFSTNKKVLRGPERLKAKEACYDLLPTEHKHAVTLSYLSKLMGINVTRIESLVQELEEEKRVKRVGRVKRRITYVRCPLKLHVGG